MFTYYFYFPERAAAESAAGELRAFGFNVEVDRGAVDHDWLVRAMPLKLQPHDSDDWESRFEDLANRLGGEYDGYEREVGA